MTTQGQAKLSHKIAKGLVCVVIVVLSVPGITLLTLASIVIWFYGEDVMAIQVMRHFKFIEKFLPAVLTQGK